MIAQEVLSTTGIMERRGALSLTYAVVVGGLLKDLKGELVFERQVEDSQVMKLGTQVFQIEGTASTRVQKS